MKRLSWFAPLLLASAFVAPLALGQPATEPIAAEATAPSLDRFVGRWRHAGSAEDARQAIERAISHAVDPMNIIVRGFAADRLRGRNQLVREITIAAPTPQRLRIVFDGDRTYETNLEEWRTHRFGGDTLEVQHRHVNGSLVQLYRSDSGRRRNVYRMLPDGQLRLEVTVTSDQLPRPMTYRVTYRRAG